MSLVHKNYFKKTNGIYTNYVIFTDAEMNNQAWVDAVTNAGYVLLTDSEYAQELANNTGCGSTSKVNCEVIIQFIANNPLPEED